MLYLAEMNLNGASTSESEERSAEFESKEFRDRRDATAPRRRRYERGGDSCGTAAESEPPPPDFVLLPLARTPGHEPRVHRGACALGLDVRGSVIHIDSGRSPTQDDRRRSSAADGDLRETEVPSARVKRQV